MRHVLLIYSPAIVLALWSAVWAVGGTGDTVIVIGLAITAIAVVAHCLELYGGDHRGR